MQINAIVEPVYHLIIPISLVQKSEEFLKVRLHFRLHRYEYESSLFNEGGVSVSKEAISRAIR